MLWIPANLWLQRHDTALLKAVVAGDVHAAREAFTNGARVSMPIRKNFTLLQVAARQGNLEIAKLLVEHGAAVAATNDAGDTALDIARVSRHPDMVDYLRSLATTNKAAGAP